MRYHLGTSAGTGNRTRAGALTVVVLAGLASAPASAADLYAPPRGPAPRLTTFDATPWTGAYVGMSVGYGWGSTRVDQPGGNFSVDTDGGLLSGFAGYTWQSGLFVLGGEAEISAGRLSGSNVNITQDLNWMGALRARAGVLVTPALYVYGLAGIAWADMRFTASGIERDQDFLGYQLGAGAEWRLARNWSLRMDYIYTGLGTEERDFPVGRTNMEPDFHTVRAGVTLRF